MEKQRLAEPGPWRRWGPYLSERQWGTVREAFGDGDVWESFTHDQARYRAYRWGEDGLAGFSDDRQRICLALALWNGEDPILKERLFGLTNAEGNHGEDVKECYFYLDATPTASYLRMLYKYPHQRFPYDDLRFTNAARNRDEPEYELLDTGIFDDDRYFDITVEYAKASPDDVLMRITAHNRGPDATLHLLPTLWFRHTWSWAGDDRTPTLHTCEPNAVRAEHAELGTWWWYVEEPVPILVTENETDNARVFGSPNTIPFLKDGIERMVIHGEHTAVTPDGVGTKAAAHHEVRIPAGQSTTVRVRFTNKSTTDPFENFDATISKRRTEADDFYDEVLNDDPHSDERLISRQALAGLLWSQQYYAFDVERWLTERGVDPLTHGQDWRHLIAEDVIVMPDKWEYPWFAAWDLAFHCAPLSLVDVDFAKEQVELLLRTRYMHPNGQLPAYEWNFGDVNPPVQAWAALYLYDAERRQKGRGDRKFLETVFTKLLLNFTWWVNRKDPHGKNVFQGGFLGMDNIGVFDRSSPPPAGATLVQSDGTSWMAMYSLNMLRIAIELAQEDDVYQDIATKFFEHFLMIGGAMTNLGDKGLGLWADQDNFFYDWLVMSNGQATPLRVRSLVGLIPLFAIEVIDEALLKKMPLFVKRLDWYLRYRPNLAALVSRWNDPGVNDTRLLAIVRAFRSTKGLERILDKDEFLSTYGVRSLSRFHLEHPYVFETDGFRSEVRYVSAESNVDLFGGNSNWRGPIWMPINYLLIESLCKYGRFFGENFRVECPVGSARTLSLNQIADELRNRLTSIFRRDEQGRRPVLGNNEKMQTDPHFKDYIPFYEYFDGETGRGLGASHQTGWSGLIANMIAELYD
ncbi:MAG: MGH1-like glycoside hydrolase domain-containing protein [Myxococcales bacterium]